MLGMRVPAETMSSLESKRRTNTYIVHPILIHPLPQTSLPVSTPNTIHRSRLNVCLPDSLDFGGCLSILFWLGAYE